MPTAQSPIARAIAELQTEREHLLARVEKVDTAIAAIRDAFHLPVEGKIRRPAVVKARRSLSSDGAGRRDLEASIIAALKAGPMAPGAMASSLGIDRARLRYAIAKLEKQRTVVSSGTTASRRIALAGASAKEAP